MASDLSLKMRQESVQSLFCWLLRVTGEVARSCSHHFLTIVAMNLCHFARVVHKSVIRKALYQKEWSNLSDLSDRWVIWVWDETRKHLSAVGGLCLLKTERSLTKVTVKKLEHCGNPYHKLCHKRQSILLTESSFRPFRTGDITNSYNLAMTTVQTTAGMCILCIL